MKLGRALVVLEREEAVAAALPLHRLAVLAVELLAVELDRVGQLEGITTAALYNRGPGLTPRTRKDTSKDGERRVKGLLDRIPGRVGPDRLQHLLLGNAARLRAIEQQIGEDRARLVGAPIPRPDLPPIGAEDAHRAEALHPGLRLAVRPVLHQEGRGASRSGSERADRDQLLAGALDSLPGAERLEDLKGFVDRRLAGRGLLRGRLLRALLLHASREHRGVGEEKAGARARPAEVGRQRLFDRHLRLLVTPEIGEDEREKIARVGGGRGLLKALRLGVGALRLDQSLLRAT